MIDETIIAGELGFGNFLFPDTCLYNVAEWYCPALDAIPFTIYLGVIIGLLSYLYFLDKEVQNKKKEIEDKLTGEQKQ